MLRGLLCCGLFCPAAKVFESKLGSEIRDFVKLLRQPIVDMGSACYPIKQTTEWDKPHHQRHIAGCCDFGQLAMETRTIVASFTHGQTQESANIWLSVSASKTSSYLEFSTQTPSGIVLETNSNAILPLAPENEEIRVFRFPEISGVAELHRVHRQIVAKYSGGPWIGDAPQGVAIERVTRIIEGYAPRLCKLGYLRLAENGKSYRLTWKGAFRVTLNGTWPVSAVRRFIARYEMRNELRSLEVHGLARLQKA